MLNEDKTVKFAWTAHLHPACKKDPIDLNDPELIAGVEARIRSLIDQGKIGGVVVYDKFAVEWSIA